MNPPPDNDPRGAPPNNHEAGHALVGMLTPGAGPARKISVMPRTLSLGAPLSAPDGSTTSLARNMVGRFDMSDGIGFLSVLPQNGEGSGLQGYSPEAYAAAGVQPARGATPTAEPATVAAS